MGPLRNPTAVPSSQREEAGLLPELRGGHTRAQRRGTVRLRRTPKAERARPTQETGEQARSWQRDKAGGGSQGEAQPQIPRNAGGSRRPVRRGGVRGQACLASLGLRARVADADSRRGLLPDLLSVGPGLAQRINSDLPSRWWGPRRGGLN